MTSQRNGCACVVCRVDLALQLELECAGPSALHEAKLPEASHSSLDHPRLVIAALRCARREDGAVADRIFKELLEADAAGEEHQRVEKILVLTFIPAVHHLVRTVATTHPHLSRDDIAQNAFAALLVRLRSPRWRAQSSYFAFSLVRQLKRDLYKWAHGETRSRVERTSPSIDRLRPAELADARSFERLAILWHFLSECHKAQIISSDELKLLIRTKLEGGCTVGESQSNAERQKLKRLVSKLRRFAKTGAVKKPGASQDTNSAGGTD